MKKKKALLITGISIGSLLALGPLWGIIGTVFGMIRTFQHISREGLVVTDRTTDGINLAISSTTIGLIAFPIGVITIVFCAIALHKLHKKL